MATTRHGLLLEGKIEVMKVVGPICRIANDGRILVQPLLKEIMVRVFDMCSGVAEVFVHGATVQHCV